MGTQPNRNNGHQSSSGSSCSRIEQIPSPIESYLQHYHYNTEPPLVENPQTHLLKLACPRPRLHLCAILALFALLVS
jgi:hypothetical protein